MVELYGQWATYELDRWSGPPTDRTVAVWPDDHGYLDTAGIDDVMHALAKHPRRVILTRLLAEDTVHDLDSFDHTELPGCTRADLHHTHVPVLEQAGFVEWDAEAGVVGRGPAFDEIEPFLRLLAMYLH